MDTCGCVPNSEHPRVQLPIGLFVAYSFCASVFLVAGVNGLASFASNTRDGNLGRCAADAQRCLPTVAFRTRCFETRSGVHSNSHTVRHGCGRTTCSIRYRRPSIRCVFSWSGRSVGGLGRIGSSVPICPTRRLATRSSAELRVGCGELMRTAAADQLSVGAHSRRRSACKPLSTDSSTAVLRSDFQRKIWKGRDCSIRRSLV